MKMSICLNLVLIFAYYFYTGQVCFMTGFLLQYLSGYLLFYLIFRPKNSLTWNVYNFFFFFYGLLVLVSHIELIKDPLENYYVHNDASDAFYPAIIDYVLPNKWSEIPNATILSPFFVNYPLPAFLFGVISKTGAFLGIENLRLFLRLHSVVIGALTMSVMADLLLRYRLKGKKVVRYLIPFGLCSYLYITSGVFTRDVHACLAYSLATYICLRPSLKHRLFYFFVVFLFSLGVRPANGLLMLIFPFSYYFEALKQRYGMIGILTMTIVIIASFVVMSSTVSDVTEALDHYEDLTNENTGGLFMKFYSLPFPINTIIIVVYVLLLPLPIDGYLIGDHETIMNLPFVLSPYLMTLVICVSIYVLIKTRVNVLLKYTILASILAFAVTVYGSPDLRRAFAAIPGLYMCYCLTEENCPKRVKMIIKRVGWTTVFVITIGLTLYVRARG